MRFMNASIRLQFILKTVQKYPQQAIIRPIRHSCGSLSKLLEVFLNTTRLLDVAKKLVRILKLSRTKILLHSVDEVLPVGYGLIS
ncbi:hypothetical protein Hanom_Chr05g00430671 [Helianthus anomalus]